MMAPKFALKRPFTLLVVVLSLLKCIFALNVPMSPCLFARATVYPVHRVEGVPHGTCGYGPIADSMPSWFRDGYIAGPDDEMYNGFPWVPPTTITTNGIGASCGECFEVTGPQGTIVVMSADICDKQCCSNCQGSLGGPMGGPDVLAIDIETSVWGQIVNQTGGNTVVGFRKVSCDTEGNTLSFFFNRPGEGNPQPTYFRMRPFNSIVGVTAVEVKGSASGGTGGQWTHLKRQWEGLFNWTDSGDIGAPFRVRITAVTGEVIEFPQDVQYSDLTHLKIIDSGLQFQQPAAGYGGAATPAHGPCFYPGPPMSVYRERLEGLVEGNMIWRNWGGTPFDEQHTQNCRGTYCLALAPLQPYGILQIGYQTFFPSAYVSHITFWARVDSGTYTRFRFYLKGTNDGTATVSSSKINVAEIGTDWRQFTYALTEFTGVPIWLQVLMWQHHINDGTSSPTIYFDDIEWTSALDDNDPRYVFSPPDVESGILDSMTHLRDGGFTPGTPTEAPPTNSPTTPPPTPQPTTAPPTPQPTTKPPTPQPTVPPGAPSNAPTPPTEAPTPNPTTAAPTPNPTTAAPTLPPDSPCSARSRCDGCVTRTDCEWCDARGLCGDAPLSECTGGAITDCSLRQTSAAATTSGGDGSDATTNDGAQVSEPTALNVTEIVTIAGIAVGVCLILTIVVACIVVFNRRRQRGGGGRYSSEPTTFYAGSRSTAFQRPYADAPMRSSVRNSGRHSRSSHRYSRNRLGASSGSGGKRHTRGSLGGNLGSYNHLPPPPPLKSIYDRAPPLDSTPSVLSASIPTMSTIEPARRALPPPPPGTRPLQ